MNLVSILEADATSLYVNRICPETLLAVLVFMNFPFYKKKKKKRLHALCWVPIYFLSYCFPSYCCHRKTRPKKLEKGAGSDWNWFKTPKTITAITKKYLSSFFFFWSAFYSNKITDEVNTLQHIVQPKLQQVMQPELNHCMPSCLPSWPVPLSRDQLLHFKRAGTKANNKDKREDDKIFLCNSCLSLTVRIFFREREWEHHWKNCQVKN